MGRVSQTDLSAGRVSSYVGRTSNLLARLRQTPDAREAIKLLIREHPDMSMAAASIISLSNQGHQIAFYSGENRLPDVEARWREFAGRVDSGSGAGLDGLINRLHFSSMALGGMAFETVVTAAGNDIEDVYPIDPATIEWVLEERGGKQLYMPYQRQSGGMVDLSRGNFFWIPFDPDIGSIAGNLMLKPAIQAIDHQMELYQNLDTVLYRMGLPRYDIVIDSEKLMAGAPSALKNDQAKLTEFFLKKVNDAQEAFSHIGVKTDFVHSDDIKIGVVGGGANTSGIDVRAYKEIADTETLNGTGMLGVLMNRYDSKTNALSSTEFQIMVDKLDARRRDSKRAVEYIAGLWLRVHGLQTSSVSSIRRSTPPPTTTSTNRSCGG